jgi:hypothetical protein
LNDIASDIVYVVLNNAFGTSSRIDLVTIFLAMQIRFFLVGKRFVAVNRSAWLNFLAI